MKEVIAIKKNPQTNQPTNQTWNNYQQENAEKKDKTNSTKNLKDIE